MRKIVETRTKSKGLTMIFDHENTFEVMENFSKVFAIDLGKRLVIVGNGGYLSYLASIRGVRGLDFAD